jgi:hypothetical protein
MGVTSILPSSQVQAAKVKKLTVKTKKITLYKGAEAGYGSTQLKVTVKPKKAKVSYKVSNKKIATVTKKGLVKAKKPGKTKVVVKAGSKKVTVKVVVKKIKKKVTKVTATKSITVAVGEKQKIKTSVKPAKATLKTLTFTSKNKKVATVNAKGAVKGVAEGSVKVVVKAVDGSKKKATVSVVVSGGAVSTATTAPAVTAATTPAVAASTNAPAADTTAAADATAAPTADVTVAPTANVTTAPTTDETAAPTTDETAAPTTDETAAPTTDETAAPTTDETAAPVVSAKPTFAPVATIDPSATGKPVEPVVSGSSITYSINVASGSTLRIKATSGSGLSSVDINSDSLKLLSFITGTLTNNGKATTATAAAVSFKATESATYGGIAINKDANSTAAEVKVSETKSYNLNLDTKTTKDENGKDQETGEVSLTLKNPETENNSLALDAKANDDGTYKVTNLSVGNQTASQDYSATVDATDDGTQTIVMTSESGDEISVKYDADGNFDYQIPKAYADKYGIEATQYN